MNSIKQRFSELNAQIVQAEQAAHRSPHSVQLLAVSKTQSAATIAKAYFLGQRHFGENYLQEALSKQRQLSAFAICWHFIGPIQSNKTKPIAQHFHWVHSVDRLKIAQRLSEQRPAQMPPLNICLQVNVSDEDSKSGIALTELAELVNKIKQLQNLRLRGVMAIPAPQSDYVLQCQPYRTLYQAVQALNLPELDTFSFGMSGDLQAAIAEGATLVRVGTALFGSRK
jgi:pyridoxal phosphate enzyme (YggS family)